MDSLLSTLMLLENMIKEYRPTVRLSPNIYHEYSINFQRASIILHFLSRDSNRNFITYWYTGIANNGNILTDERDEREYQEKKYN